MRYRFLTADVFTDRIFGGNQLAVLPDAEGLSAAQMQRVAREFNFSETVFVLPPDAPENTCKLRIFAPEVELPFAGHPTVGTAFVLASIGRIALDGETTGVVFEEGVGPVAVSIRADGGRPISARLTAAKLPELGPEPPPIADLAATLSLDASDVVDGDDAPQAISCGVPFLFVPLRDRDAVGRARLDTARWRESVERYWAPHVYVFARDGEREGSDVRARMFAPAMGIVEDPATGAAATALGGYLASRDERREGTLRWVVEQGFEMGRPSILEIEVDKRDGAIAAVHVGGASVLVAEGEIEIPE